MNLKDIIYRLCIRGKVHRVRVIQNTKYNILYKKKKLKDREINLLLNSGIEAAYIPE